MDIKEFIVILNEKRKAVVAVLIVSVIVSLVANFVLPSYYETKVVFMVLESKMIRRNLEGKKLDIDTYLNFVNNDSVFYHVYKKLDIAKRFDMDFETFKKSFDTVSVEDTAIIELTVTFPDKDASYEIAKEVSNRVLALNKSVIEMEVKSGYRFAEKRLEEAKSQYAKAKAELEKFLEQNKVFLKAEQVELLRSSLAVFSGGYFLPYLNSEFSTFDLKGNRLINNNTSVPGKGSLSLTDINVKIVELRAEIKNSVYDNQKAKLKKELAYFLELKKEKEKLIEKTEKSLSSLQGEYNRVKFSFLEKYYKFVSAGKAYEQLLTNVLTIKIEIAGKTKEMAVIGFPVPPERPVFPRLSVMLVAGVFIGGLIDFLYILFIGFYRKINV